MADRNLRLRFVLDALDRVSGPMKDIAGGSTRAARALRETRDALRALEDQQKQIAGYQRQQGALAEQMLKLDAAREKQRALAAQIAATTTPTKTLQKQYDKVGREVARLEHYTQGQTEALDHMAGEMRSAGIDVGNLAHHEADLAGRITLTTERLREQQARLDRAAAARQRYEQRSGTAQKMAVGGAVTMGAGAAVLAPMRATVGAARDYESVMTDIAQKSDMSRAAARKLGDDLRTVAVRTNQYAADIQRGMDVLTGKGLDAAVSAKMMAPIGRAATAYKADMADMASAGFAVYDNLKVPIDKVAQALDIMAAGGKAGSFELKDMAQYFPALSAGYTALGQQGVGAVADLTAALEIATKGAGNAAEAANNVQNLINKLQSKEVVANFAKFGVDLPKALKKAYAEGKTPIEAIAELTDKALGGKMDKLSYLFGDAQVQAALRPLLQNMTEYRRIRSEALRAAGTVESDFTVRMQDAAEKAKANDIALKNLSLSVGALLLPTVTLLAEKITHVANSLSAWASRHPKLAQAIAITTAAIGGLLVVLGGIGIVAGAVIKGWAVMAFTLTKLGPLLKLAFGGLRLIAVGIRIVTAALASNPILLAIMAIAAAVYLIYRNWDTILPWLQNLWNKIKEYFFAGVDFLTKKVPAMMAEVGMNIVHGLWDGILRVKDWLIAKLTEFAKMIPEPIRKALNIHSPSRVFAEIGGHITAGLDQGIAAGASAPLKRIGKLSGQLTRAFAVSAAVAGPVAVPAAAHDGALARLDALPAHSANPSAKARVLAAGAALPQAAAPAEPDRMPPLRIDDLAAELTRAVARGAAMASPIAAPPVSARAPQSPAPAAGIGVSRRYDITIKAEGAAAEGIAQAVREAIAQIERDRSGRSFRDEDE